MADQTGQMTSPDPEFTRPPDNLTITEREVHVWKVWLDDWEERLRPASDLLEPAERQQAASYRSAQDRQRFVCRRILLKKLWGQYLGMAPGRIRFTYNPHGKPEVAIGSRGEDWQFTVSHSQGLAIFVFGRNRRLGVDLESLRPLPEVEGLISSWFPGKQGRFVQNLPDKEKHLAFYRLWTLKEAYLKALGKGFDSPGQVANFIPDALITSWCHPSVSSYRMGSWSFRLLIPSADFVATLAVDGDDCHLRCFEWKAAADYRSRC